ncbi:NADPH:quinone oxidoreductase family protein [Mycolicibacterium sp.]|uniref:NADPH:quinone oxidoreductase family protein n=1 Tax=Mycolicibacterium sp. TaxID=2320850 RepID=UPI003D0BD390
MRAVVVNGTDGPSSVSVEEVPRPLPGPKQVAIRVRAAGVTFPDLLYARGEYQVRPELPFRLGQECAGVVLHAPTDSKFSPGDRVAAYCSDLGAFADVVVVDADGVVPLPGSVPYGVGAALMINYLTAHFGLIRRGRLGSGQSVVIHGATGGVGTAAIQIAVEAGARVIAVVSTVEKATLARAIGAHDVVLADGFRDSVQRLMPAGVDLVFDTVGDERFADSVRILKPEGNVLVVGFAGGSIPTVKVNKLLLTNTGVLGVGWGRVALEPGYIAGQWAELLPGIAGGRLRPPITGSFPLEHAAAALSRLTERHAGKSILEVSVDDDLT